jgi:hypothetical protein
VQRRGEITNMTCGIFAVREKAVVSISAEADADTDA